jgi:hypothetical protein
VLNCSVHFCRGLTYLLSASITLHLFRIQDLVSVFVFSKKVVPKKLNLLTTVYLIRLKTRKLNLIPADFSDFLSVL